MQSKPLISSSTVLFLGKLKNLIQSIGITFDDFFNNLQTINTNQISRLEFLRILNLIHMEAYHNFDPQKVFYELSKSKQTIQTSDLKKLILAIADIKNEKKLGQQKIRQDEMKKKVIRMGLYKLQEYMAKLTNPIVYFQQFDLDGNFSISKTEFNKILVATDIKEFASRQIRKMIVDHIYKYFPKGEISISELCSFFKLAQKVQQKKDLSPNNGNNQSFPKMNVHNQKGQTNPINNHMFQKIDPFGSAELPKKTTPIKMQNNQHLKVPSPKKNEFQKKQQIPQIKTINAQGASNNKKQENKDSYQHSISNCQKNYPNSLKYYRLGDPQPYEYQILQQFENLLTKNGKYRDKDNPKIHEGSYAPSSSIFKGKYHIFQMASSVLMRQKSRIGVAQQIQPKDIIQGSVGDCYLLSSIASIISIYPELIAQRFLININPSDFYAVKLFIDGEWKIITTDDWFPCRGNMPLFAKPHTNEIWVMLLEKCWAKEFGSYKAIEAGSSKQGFLALTGAPCEAISQDKEASQQQAIKQLQLAQKNRYVATMSGSSYLQSLGKKGQQQYGLIAGHAYSMLKILKIQGTTLVKLRNPWGKTIWKGEWSFNSNKWTKQLRDRYNYNRNPQDGSFYMSWSDFHKFFGEIVICKLNPTYMHNSLRLKTKRHKSAYLHMLVKTRGQYIVSIYQANKRKMGLKYSNYQYSQARLIILKRQGNKMRYVGSRSTSQYQVCSVDVQLDQGEYIMSAKVAWKFWQQGELVVTSYGTDHVTLSPTNRAIAPLFKEYMIKTYATMYAGTGKVKSYEKYGFDATCETNFLLESGIGFVRMVNKSDKSFESIQQMEIKGLKLIKPDHLPLQFIMGPHSQKVYGFFVTPSGFEYSNTEKLKYK